ncbi:metal dependent phosphohydrolase [Cotonvirus japonicus]|uniref:Metal dependent phosphohydrolase n=1 Tax=Cotonvirus japonicus TaxID=2811091 RepID=A0ABM7NU27_9VIRU|nr:metal dependent phosphohydrolase [Cotonvirus japonicus]BCS83567.1 metal dependent phosphohydrolase [Cotonvirus japonicus]
MTNKNTIENLRELIEQEIRNLMVNHNVAGHNIDHFFAVRDHALRALKFENLSPTKNLQVELAAVLHDIDDTKIFPDSGDYRNAKMILDKVFDKIQYKDVISDINYDDFKSTIIQLISLVSCSKNGDDEPPESWMAIPRDADRLEAIGEIGIQRCLEYTMHIKLPFYTSETPRPKSRDEVISFATKERFDKYKSGHKSVSMIDHYYDKLLHIGKPECLCSKNKYILEEASKRTGIMIDFVFNYDY